MHFLIIGKSSLSLADAPSASAATATDQTLQKTLLVHQLLHANRKGMFALDIFPDKRPAPIPDRDKST
jgi:hypothetical protein